MNTITQALLGGAALLALATSQGSANNLSPFHVTALHAGRMVNKTRIHRPGRIDITYTISTSTHVPASDLGVTVKLGVTYYKWNSQTVSGAYTICSNPKQKIKLSTKKTAYAKLGTSTETYSYGCTSGPTVFHGDTYDLFNKAGFGQTDHFVSTLIGKFGRKAPSAPRYKGTLNLDVNVGIGP